MIRDLDRNRRGIVEEGDGEGPTGIQETSHLVQESPKSFQDT